MGNQLISDLTIMYLLPLGILGLFSVNCYEGGVPCGSQTDAKEAVLAIIKELECADLYVVTDECKELVKSSEQKFVMAIEEFVKSGEDLNFRWDRWENTLLQVAVSRGYKKAVVTLIENGAGLEEGDKYGYTALIDAARNKAEMLRLLLKHGASVNAELNDGGSALTFAAENSNNDIAEILLNAGSKVNNQDGIGFTPLTYAAREGNIKLVNDLLERGALTSLRAIPNRNEATALITASFNGHDAVVTALLAHGADPDEANSRGITGLFWAAKHGHTNIVSILLSNGASVDGKIPKETPLMVAAEHGMEEIVGILLKNGADPKVKGSYRNTALDYARYGGYTKIQEMIK